jgi:hypothetical protein
MIVRPYVAETAVSAGCGVVQGAKENAVKKPAANGAGDFIGVFAFDPHISVREAGEHTGITLAGVVKVRAGGNVTAGKKAVLKPDESGTFINLPEEAGAYSTCGLFLQSGEADEYVEMLVERGSVTIIEEET